MSKNNNQFMDNSFDACELISRWERVNCWNATESLKTDKWSADHWKILLNKKTSIAHQSIPRVVSNRKRKKVTIEMKWGNQQRAEMKHSAAIKVLATYRKCSRTNYIIRLLSMQKRVRNPYAHTLRCCIQAMNETR